jgi:putative PIN family toxin of toxin-antitoxin system
MRVFFDTNVYVAEALVGAGAAEMVTATEDAGWRICASTYLLDELERVLTEQLGFSQRLSMLTRQRIIRRAAVVEPGASRHAVAGDPADTPILRAAITAGADYLVTNDRHLLDLHPYEGLRIISMTDYRQILVNEGVLPTNP